MRAVVQRVGRARVTVEGETVGEIGLGLAVLVGVAKGDLEEDARILAGKVARLRIFSDAQGKMNLAAGDVGGAVLAVSQFTLLADTRRGNRPSFAGAAPPEEAERLYARFCDAVAAEGLPVARGRFAAHMHVELENDGPVTIVMDTEAHGRS